MDQEIINSFAKGSFVYTPMAAILNLFMAFVLGMIVSYVYRISHRGLSYSQSFVLTIVLVTIVTASVIMVIGNSLARAFALVGALSIIRFRTVVKDTKDTAFVFLGLAVGMASGTSNYFLAIYTTLFLTLVILLLHKFNYAVLEGNEFILRFYADKNNDDDNYLNLIMRMAKNYNLLHLEPVDGGDQVYLTYDLSLKEPFTAKGLITELSKIEGVTEVVLVSSKSDIDY